MAPKQPKQQSMFGDSAAACLTELALQGKGAEEALDLLVHDTHALLVLLEHVAAERQPEEQPLPNIDGLVQDRLTTLYGGRLPDAGLLLKKQKFGDQNRLLLSILLSRCGEPVPLVELLLANNLSTDTPKRIRELRHEHGGWDVVSTGTGRQSMYTLRSSVPDIDSSARWWLLNNIRNLRALGPAERILRLLQAHLGQAVPLDDIQYVNPQRESGGRGRARQAQAETSRRVRALREAGWQVYSGLDNVVTNLAPSDYIMLTLDRLPPYERLKPKAWKAIIDRDARTCQHCGWQPESESGPSQGRKCLEVHHKHPQQARPEDVNNPNNLITLCNICHDAAR